MASGRDYLEFILEQLSDLDGITYRAMMGEYILYFRGRIAGGIYDNRLLIKPVPSANAMLPDAPIVSFCAVYLKKFMTTYRFRKKDRKFTRTVTVIFSCKRQSCIPK